MEVIRGHGCNVRSVQAAFEERPGSTKGISPVDPAAPDVADELDSPATVPRRTVSTGSSPN